MPLTPPPSRFYLALLAPLLGCHVGHAAPGAPDYPTTDRLPDSRRQPDGVALDPLPAPTQGVLYGEAPTPTPLALQPPLPLTSAAAILLPLLEALTQEDLAALAPLFTERATWVTLPSRASMPALTHFRERLRRFDYLQLAGQTVVREADAEIYSHGELEALPPGRPVRPPEMTPGDVLLRVRVLVPRLGADRLFGDTWLLVLRPQQGHYRIHSLQEEFQLP